MCDEYEWVGLEEFGRALAFPDVVRLRGDDKVWVVESWTLIRRVKVVGVGGTPEEPRCIQRILSVDDVEVRRPRRLAEEEKSRLVTATIRSAAEFVRDLRIKRDATGEGRKLCNQIAKLIEEQADV